MHILEVPGNYRDFKGSFTPIPFGLDFLTFHFDPNQNNRCETSPDHDPDQKASVLSDEKRWSRSVQTDPWFSSSPL